MAEWLKAHAWKACLLERVTWVRIPLSPPDFHPHKRCEDHKRHMRLHRLRDTFAVELLQNGVPLEEVSKLLGHNSIKTTEKSYAKWVKGRQDRLNSLVIATWKNQ